MGVTKKPIYAREALLPMSFPAKSFQKNYVPFVDPTDAPKAAATLRRGKTADGSTLVPRRDTISQNIL
jgi:hypothetical protein